MYRGVIILDILVANLMFPRCYIININVISITNECILIFTHKVNGRQLAPEWRLGVYP